MYGRKNAPLMWFKASCGDLKELKQLTEFQADSIIPDFKILFEEIFQQYSKKLKSINENNTSLSVTFSNIDVTEGQKLSKLFWQRINQLQPNALITLNTEIKSNSTTTFNFGKNFVLGLIEANKKTATLNKKM